MTTELRSLDAAELTRLGGLKTQCRAALLCTEHNAPSPCEVCEALGYASVACAACLQEFPEGMSTAAERPCASQAVFAKTGRVAFEADAMAALADRARDKESARERKKREKEATERARAEQARQEQARKEAEAAERAVLERVARDLERQRLERERAERERIERIKDPTPEPSGDAALGARRARLVIGSSLFSAIAGAYTLWQEHLIDMPSASIGILMAYSVTVLLVWFAGLETMTGKAPAHANLRWWAPLAWAFMTLTWPGVAGLTVAYLIGVSGLGFLMYAVQILLGLGLLVAAVSCIAYGGVALTLRPPWPKGLFDAEFRSLRSGWIWVALLATLALNANTLSGSGRLLEFGSDAPSVPAAPSQKPLIDPVGKKPSPKKDMSGFVRATLADIAEAVNDHPRLAGPAGPGVLPQVDAAVAALRALPSPREGDRLRARYFVNQANLASVRDPVWPEVADVLAQAHAADPQDADILASLAFAQMQAGRHGLALASALESLRLAPRSTNGWTRLAQIRLVSANGDPRQVQEAARYYVVAYWFAQDRRQMLRYLNGKRKVGPGDSPDNPAAVSIALQRLPK
jgi:hypothetical protein